MKYESIVVYTVAQEEHYFDPLPAEPVITIANLPAAPFDPYVGDTITVEGGDGPGATASVEFKDPPKPHQGNA